MKNSFKIAIIGGGPGGLFAAYLLLENGHQVDVYDQSSGLAKKFLIAGNGGLNLTHSEDLDLFATRYGKDENFFKELLRDFSPTDLRNWCHSLGVETFVGSSGRVFPKKLKAGEILIKWTKKLKSYPQFNLFLQHSLIKLTKEKELIFKSGASLITKQYDKVILSLGGASWPQTGSDGKWKSFLGENDIVMKPFFPMNCGFEHKWSDFFKKKIDHSPLKNIQLHIGDHKVRGEIMLTPFGIEGGAVYAISNFIRDAIDIDGHSSVLLDLKPDLSFDEIKKRLDSKSPKQSLSHFIHKTLNLSDIVYTLLVELSNKSQFDDSAYLAGQIKNLELILTAPRPIEEAISTSGGVCFSELDSSLELKKMPGVYIVGEMLDFEAPTGGYLLQGCFSTAFRAAKSF